MRSQRPQPRKSYAELPSESDSGYDSYTESRQQPRRRSSRTRPRTNNDPYDSPSQNDLKRPQIRNAPAQPRAHITRSAYKSSQSSDLKDRRREDTIFRKFKRQKIDHNDQQGLSRKAIDSTSIPVHIVHSRSVQIIPPWQTLEYQILLKIMQYAAHPLYHGASRDTGAMRWLLNTSELCSSFHDACMGALMYAPPLFPVHRAHWLVSLLKASRKLDDAHSDMANERRVSLDYRRKVKRLDIEVKQLLVMKHGIDLDELLPNTPLLTDLRLYHNHDQLGARFIWAQAQHSKMKWQYGMLFDSMDINNIILQSFEWNGRFMKQDPAFSTMLYAHSQKCLSGLRRIDILNLNVPNADKDDEVLRSARQNLLGALQILPRLQSMSLQSCNILDSPTLSALPDNLQSLAVSSCPYITGDGIKEYMRRAGSSLRRLYLISNQAMDLGFMSAMSSTCPQLERLEIDLNFHDPTSFKDTEPLFDELIPDGPPTWPSTLQSIDIGPLRALNAADAEDFYNALIDSAPELPFLRVLKLKTLLNDISWRDRAQMRSKWQALFDEVFNVKFNHEIRPPSIIRLERVPKKADNVRQSARIRQRPEDSSRHASPGGTTTDDGNDYTGHGRCHTVAFELSDQRPAQEQWREQDFLDEEPKDDAEWNGKDDSIVPKYSARRYAW